MEKINGKILKLPQQGTNNDYGSDYEVVPEQMEKLTKAYELLVELAAVNNGKVEKLRLIPSEKSAGVTAYFTVLYVDNEDLCKIAKILEGVSALSLDCTIDGTVCISFTIPGVFKLKWE